MTYDRQTETRTIHIKSDPRLPSRPIEEMVRAARGFNAEITLIHRGVAQASAKSLLSVLELCAQRPRQVTVMAEGPDAAAAVEAIEAFFDNGVLEMADLPGSPA